jgi:very-short-patch-repair endonuclease
MNKGGQYRGGYQSSGLKDLARELRKKQTSGEGLLWALIRNRQLLGFKFRRQHQFGDYVADSYCHEAKLVIECDGPVHQANEQWQHDQNRDSYMIGQGLRVLRFSNEQILNDFEKVLDDIARILPSPFGRGVGGEGCSITLNDLEIGSFFGGNQYVAKISSSSRVWYDSKKREEVCLLKPSPQPSPRGRGSKASASLAKRLTSAFLCRIC